MKKSKIEQWLVYVSLMPWGTFPGSKDRLSKEKNNVITGKYWDHNYAVYGFNKFKCKKSLDSFLLHLMQTDDILTNNVNLFLHTYKILRILKYIFLKKS